MPSRGSTTQNVLDIFSEDKPLSSASIGRVDSDLIISFITVSAETSAWSFISFFVVLYYNIYVTGLLLIQKTPKNVGVNVF